MAVKIWILDTTAIILGKKPEGCLTTVPEVIEEVRDRISRLKLEISEIDVEDASDRYIGDIMKNAEKTGDIHRLSGTDIKLLARALELKESGYHAVILTDDYTVQNMAYHLKIPFESVVQKGISKEYKWEKVCSGCRRVTPDHDICPVCGSPVVLKRRN